MFFCFCSKKNNVFCSIIGLRKTILCPIFYCGPVNKLHVEHKIEKSTGRRENFFFSAFSLEKQETLGTAKEISSASPPSSLTVWEALRLHPFCFRASSVDRWPSQLLLSSFCPVVLVWRRSSRCEVRWLSGGLRTALVVSSSSLLFLSHLFSGSGVWCFV